MIGLRVIFLLGIFVASGISVFAGVIPSESVESHQSICDKHKVSCDPGWSCQAGFLLFPTENNVKCESDESGTRDCETTSIRVGIDSMEVFCVRDDSACLKCVTCCASGELTGLGILKNGKFHDDFKFLSRFRQKRHRRAGCAEFCNKIDDCSPGEFCISNGCGRVCAKKL